MKGKITKLFRPEGIVPVDQTIEFDEKGVIIAEEGKGYTEVETFGKVIKVDIAANFAKSEKLPRTDFQGSADDIPNTDFISNEGANAILWRENGAITEALIAVLEK